MVSRPYWIFILLCFALFLLHLNYLYVDIMEARNFVSAREMVNEGNWIFTTMNGEARYQKPPVPTWLSAFMGELFGTQTLWALRFPAALSCIAMVFCFYKIMRDETKNQHLAVVSGLVLATAFLVLLVGKRATWDIFCYSFTLIGVYCFYLTFKATKKNLLNFTLAGFFLGLSILSKGPTGFYVIAAPFFLAYWMVYGFPKVKWTGWIWMGLLTVVIGFSWYLYIYLHDSETFLSIMEAESSARANREVKPFTRYLSFPVQMGVWAIFALVSLIFPYVLQKTKFKKQYQFFFWWTLICFVLLSLVPSKKERYLFPLMIPLAATTGIYLYYLIQNQDWRKWEKILVKFSFALLGTVGLIIPILLFFILKTELNFYSLAWSIVGLLIGVYLLVQTFNFHVKNAFWGAVALVSSAMLLGMPVIDSIFKSNPNYQSLLTQKERIEKSGLKLYGFNAYSPEIWFKYGEKIPEIYLEKPDTWPKEKEFYLISIDNQPVTSVQKALDEHGMKATFIRKFDDNEEKPGSKNHVDRKRMLLFKVN